MQMELEILMATKYASLKMLMEMMEISGKILQGFTNLSCCILLKKLKDSTF
jgi:hypothetical protein